MVYRQYRYKFYLNMNHSVTMNGHVGQIHSHTWEICMSISMANDGEIVPFYQLEQVIDGVLDKYQDKYINEVSPFDEINPTLENVCEYLHGVFDEKLKEHDWMLLCMEMSENPSKSYQISNLDTEF